MGAAAEALAATRAEDEAAVVLTCGRLEARLARQQAEHQAALDAQAAALDAHAARLAGALADQAAAQDEVGCRTSSACVEGPRRGGGGV